MKQLRHFCTGEAIIELQTKIPPVGEYYSIVIDCDCIPIDEKKHCLYIKYHLVNCETLDDYEFAETYYLGGNNPKTANFIQYLEENLIDYEFAEEYIGTRDKLTISVDYLGGMEHPFIAKRVLMSKSPRLNNNEGFLEDDAYFSISID